MVEDGREKRLHRGLLESNLFKTNLESRRSLKEEHLNRCRNFIDQPNRTNRGMGSSAFPLFSSSLGARSRSDHNIGFLSSFVQVRGNRMRNIRFTVGLHILRLISVSQQIRLQRQSTRTPLHVAKCEGIRNGKRRRKYRRCDEIPLAYKALTVHLDISPFVSLILLYALSYTNSFIKLPKEHNPVLQKCFRYGSLKCFTPLPEDLTLKHRAEGMEAKLSPVHLLLMSIFRIDPKSYSQLYPEEVRKTCE